MDVLSIILIAVGLSMDSFAVSISNGLIYREISFKKIFIIASSFAFFQALMPFIGWLAGVGIEEYIKEFDHWIAFILLSFIGGKMIYEAFTHKEDNRTTEINAVIILGQSIATSIDAFAVGISFAFLNISILSPVIIIGLITFLFSVLGLQLGKYFGHKLGKSVEIFGGIVLIGIGMKILIEHIYFQ